MLKYSKLSDYKIKKIMTHFCVDIPATKTALLLNMNRNTVTRFFRLFREAICYHQENEFKKSLLVKSNLMRAISALVENGDLKEN
jgi:hypothetical protein